MCDTVVIVAVFKPCDSSHQRFATASKTAAGAASAGAEEEQQTVTGRPACV